MAADPRPRRSKEKAKALGIMGWNILCSRCGDYGATWANDQREILALCPWHMQELAHEETRHEEALRVLLQVNYKQEQ